jgi:hypothetical protein
MQLANSPQCIGLASWPPSACRLLRESTTFSLLMTARSTSTHCRGGPVPCWEERQKVRASFTVVPICGERARPKKKSGYWTFLHSFPTRSSIPGRARIFVWVSGTDFPTATNAAFASLGTAFLMFAAAA